MHDGMAITIRPLRASDYRTVISARRQVTWGMTSAAISSR
jgi:hypothetical protein